MKIVYSLARPGDDLSSEEAGHTIRARAMLTALEKLGNEVIVVQAAESKQAQTAVKSYRSVVKKWIPSPIALRMRDVGRTLFSRRFSQKVFDAVETHQPDILLGTHVVFSLAEAIASRQTGVPLVVDDLAPSWEEEKTYGVGSTWLAHKTHRDLTQQASLMVAVNETMYGFLLEDGIPAKKLVIVSNGFDDERFHPGVDGSQVRQQAGIPEDALVIVFVGSFQPYHGVDLLLRAFARVRSDRPLHLLLVGEGRETPPAKAIAQQLNLMNRVTFTGRVPYQDVVAYTATGDITIMPATNIYGNPMKVYEYMALGKPVLAPDQPTITEIATHDKDAYLFPPENIEAMVAAIQTVINDEYLQARLGRTALKTAAGHTWDKRGEALHQAIIERVLNKSS